MRGQKQRFGTFPFSAICVSQSSVEVVENQLKKLQAVSSPASTSKQLPPPLVVPLVFSLIGDFTWFIRYSQRVPSGLSSGEIQSKRRTKSTFLPLHKVFKSFKSLSYMFQSYNEGDDDDEEIEMVIGLPTDVQHVGHIGWDGFNGWDKSQELLSLPTMSLKQFELAMAASQANQ